MRPNKAPPYPIVSICKHGVGRAAKDTSPYRRSTAARRAKTNSWQFRPSLLLQRPIGCSETRTPLSRAWLSARARRPFSPLSAPLLFDPFPTAPRGVSLSSPSPCALLRGLQLRGEVEHGPGGGNRAFRGGASPRRPRPLRCRASQCRLAARGHRSLPCALLPPGTCAPCTCSLAHSLQHTHVSASGCKGEEFGPRRKSGEKAGSACQARRNQGRERDAHKTYRQL